MLPTWHAKEGSPRQIIFQHPTRRLRRREFFVRERVRDDELILMDRSYATRLRMLRG